MCADDVYGTACPTMPEVVEALEHIEESLVPGTYSKWSDAGAYRFTVRRGRSSGAGPLIDPSRLAVSDAPLVVVGEASNPAGMVVRPGVPSKARVDSAAGDNHISLTLVNNRCSKGAMVKRTSVHYAIWNEDAVSCRREFSLDCVPVSQNALDTYTGNKTTQALFGSDFLERVGLARVCGRWVAFPSFTNNGAA